MLNKFLVKSFLSILISASLFSCASKELIRDTEYAPSFATYRNSAFVDSLENFPKKEKKGFITSVEKAWIGLWAQQGDNSQLEEQIKSLDSRTYTSVSREAEYFFLNESEDGYIPAEHEIIALHLINSMIYMQDKKWESAEVEARRASYFLQKIFNPGQPHFDDPALRLWLAAVWLNLGYWNEAQVDLRKIYELTGNKDIQKLYELEQAPKFFRLKFNGAGPELEWRETSDMPVFNIVYTKAANQFSTLAWYERHLKRNTAIRDVVLKSNYMAQYVGIKSLSNTQRVVGTSLGVGTQILGVVLGGAIIVGGIYVASQATTAVDPEALGYVMAGGFVAGSYFWDEGKKVTENTWVSAKKYEDVEFEKLRTYRYVRFLPSTIAFILKPADLSGSSARLTFPRDKSSVEFVLNP